MRLHRVRLNFLHTAVGDGNGQKRYVTAADGSPGDGETDFVGDRQDPLQVLRAKGAGLPEGDAGGKALDDD